MIARLTRKALSFGIRAEVLQLTFAAGAVVGMIYMAVLLTVPRIAGLVIAGLLR